MDKPVIGFYGTGIMGNPMVKNLLKAGYTVNVWNRTAAKLADLTALGAKVPGSPRDVAAASDICIAIFMGPEPLDEVMEGPDGILAGLKLGSIFIDMGTHPPRNAVRLADQARIREVMMAGHSASPVLERQGQQMIERKFNVGRPIKDYLKDSQSIADALNGTQLKLPLGEAILQRVRDVVDAGKGDLNESSLYMLLDARPA